MYRKASVAVVLAGLLAAMPLVAQQPDSAKPAPAAKHQVAPKPAGTMAQSAKPKTAPKHHYTKDEITAAQEGLAKAGFYKGKATGVWNSETTRALRAWQKANKEKITGRLTEDELAKLKTQPQG